MNIETLRKEYKALAKRADQRLVRLEKAESDQHYQNVTKWSYAKAQKDIKSVFGEGHNRFNLKLPEEMTERQLQASINKVKSFLESPTSTKIGIKHVYQDRAKTMNEQFGMNLTWQQWANVLESGAWEAMDKKFGYRTAVEKMKNDISKKKNQKVSDTVKKNGNVKVSNDILNDVITDMLSVSGVDIGDL